MQNHRPILSICIPTNGVVEWVVPTLESVYSQNVDFSLFEVVITDNGEDSKLGEAIKNYKYPNLVYIQTKDKGFLNLVTCLQKGNGLFNKMLNHRMMLKPGMMQAMIDVVIRYKETKPVMYFLNGCLNLPEFQSFNNIDGFVSTMNIYCSWSAGIGFWDIDIKKLSEIKPNEMFPNTSLLFEHRQESDYVIWNGIYGRMQSDSGKGGYDVFHAFAVDYLSIIYDLHARGRISKGTKKYVKKRLYYFLTDLYFNEVILPTKHTFIIQNLKKSFSVYYGVFIYRVMQISVLIKIPFSLFRKIYRKIKSKFIMNS